MYINNRKMSAARKRMKEKLVALGWMEHENRYYRPSTKMNINQRDRSPHIDDIRLEKCLKDINTGEAFYALESYAMQLPHVAWRCNKENPNNRYPLDEIGGADEAMEMMYSGIDFDYTHGEGDPDREEAAYKGHITIIDWEKPERNTYEFCEAWCGARNDGWGWDFILLVNAIPVGGVVLEEDDKTDADRLPCQRAYEVASEQFKADYQFPCYCYAWVLGNGKELRMGDPYNDLERYREPSEEGDLKPHAFLENWVHRFAHEEDENENENV